MMSCISEYPDDKDKYLGDRDDNQSVDADGDGYIQEDDCDDQNAEINPSADEACDGLDNNCDGQEDEGVLLTFFMDSDGDGYGVDDSIEACFAVEEYGATNADDCDDQDPTLTPADADGDGYSTCDGDCDDENSALSLTDADGDGYSTCANDCDDNDAVIFPSAVEICDGIDNNCDGQIDEGLSATLYLDGDGDGYGNEIVGDNLCPEPGTSLMGGDCDDQDATIYPSAPEVCDGVINDCDASELPADESDDDGDGYVDCDVDAATWQGAQIIGGNDCDDTNSAYILEQFWYTDSDGDGDGDPNTIAVGCVPQSDQVAVGTDCDDAEATVFDGAPELCDGIDNDCDMLVPSNETDDDGDGYVECAVELSTWLGANISGGSDCDDNDATMWIMESYYADSDGDGYGDPYAGVVSCTALAGYVQNNLDCNDNDIAMNPQAAEICNGLDDNCDGTIDDGFTFTSYYFDNDGDGYGDAAQSVTACSQPAGAVMNSSDCDDANAQIHPFASEVCNSVDDDCDGSVDESVGTTYYQDYDGDGYGSSQVSVVSCTQPAGYVANGGDCDDNNTSLHPEAPEYAGATDHNCDGLEAVDSSCYSSSYSGVYFLFCSDNIGWYDAEDRCIDHGYEFVSVHDTNENSHILSNSGSSGSWIGLRDYSGDQYCGQEAMNFRWSDGTGGSYRIIFWSTCSTSIQALGYFNFANNEPNNSVQTRECTKMASSGEWYDEDCSTTLPYVCTLR